MTKKFAADREPIEIHRINDVLEFLKGRLTPEDYTTCENMMDDMLDDAEDTKLAAGVVKDSFSPEMRRHIRRTARGAVADAKNAYNMAQDSALGRSATPVQDFNNRYPDATRIRFGDNGPQPKRKPGPAMDSASSAGLNARFGTDRLRGGL